MKPTNNAAAFFHLFQQRLCTRRVSIRGTSKPGNAMSNGVLPKTQASKSSLKSNELSEDAKVQISNSDFSFELKPKPKLTCIPENCSKFLSDLRWVECVANKLRLPWMTILVNHFAEKLNRWTSRRKLRCQRSRGQFYSSARKVICMPKI